MTVNTLLGHSLRRTTLALFLLQSHKSILNARGRTDEEACANRGLVGGTFPNNCQSKNLTAHEKALEFLLFDLSSCIQDDNNPPPPPVH